MISSRYAAPVAALLTLALIPTLIHNYWGTTVADGLSAGAIAATLGGIPSTATNRRAAWVKERFESHDWIERIYRTGQDDVVVFVGRSYDAKRLYHHPELALLRGTETTGAGRARPAARPDVPLHVLTSVKGSRKGVAVYALLYDGRFIENPILFQLRTAVELLVGGRKPLTLFMASDLSGTVDRLDDAPATRVLLAAIASFEQQRPEAPHAEGSAAPEPPDLASLRR